MPANQKSGRGAICEALIVSGRVAKVFRRFGIVANMKPDLGEFIPDKPELFSDVHDAIGAGHAGPDGSEDRISIAINIQKFKLVEIIESTDCRVKRLKFLKSVIGATKRKRSRFVDDEC